MAGGQVVSPVRLDAVDLGGPVVLGLPRRGGAVAVHRGRVDGVEGPARERERIKIREICPKFAAAESI